MNACQLMQKLRREISQSLSFFGKHTWFQCHFKFIYYLIFFSFSLSFVIKLNHSHIMLCTHHVYICHRHRGVIVVREGFGFLAQKFMINFTMKKNKINIFNEVGNSSMRIFSFSSKFSSDDRFSIRFFLKNSGLRRLSTKRILKNKILIFEI